MVRPNRRRKTRVGIVVFVPAVIVLIVVVYFFFALQRPTEAELEGTWVHSGPGGREATLTLNDDGSFTASVPQQIFTGPSSRFWGESLDWKNFHEAHGKWEVSQSHNDLLGSSPKIRITIFATEDFSGYGTSMSSFGVGPWRSLAIYYGPADNEDQFDFTKQ
ncbi:hypothetical protein [Subtercola boreus]|uniref:hypothetical protein n=1 Tax=Subtercola boreus TaxID=120213 RepID=UPI0011C0661F|nr:hypothetical protein [Subtercola boreus]